MGWVEQSSALSPEFRGPSYTLISFKSAIWLLKSLFVWKLTTLSTPKFTWCLLFPWNIMCLMRTEGLIIHLCLGVIHVHILLGKGLSRSPTPCATHSTSREPEVQRSDQSVQGHPPHISVKCCTAPLAPWRRDTPTRAMQLHPSSEAMGETPSQFKTTV